MLLVKNTAMLDLYPDTSAIQQSAQNLNCEHLKSGFALVDLQAWVIGKATKPANAAEPLEPLTTITRLKQ